MKSIFFTVCITIVFSVSAAFGQVENAPTWEAAEKYLRDGWAKKYPGDEILSIEKNGDLGFLEKKAYGRIIDKTLKYPFAITIKKDGMEKVFDAGVLYVQRGKNWIFSEILRVKEMIKAAAGNQKPD